MTRCHTKASRTALVLTVLSILASVRGSESAVPGTPGRPPEIVSLKKIWDRANHSAFPDLIQFKKRWFVSFREGDGHVGPDGKIRILMSRNGETWEPVALLEEEGVDLRDPKLSVTPDGWLMLLAGGSIMREKSYVSRQPRVSFSKNGREWTRPDKILTPNHWLWRLTWHGGKGYGVSYFGGGGLKEQRRGFLFVTSDGLNYEMVTELELPEASETTLRFTPDNEMVALSRSGNEARIGTSRPPYLKWEWKVLPNALGGPNFIMLSEGCWVAGSRQWEAGRKNPKTGLAWMTRTSYKPCLQFPSSGDNSYPGLVWHKGLLWVCYYSSHEGRTSVYLAKVRLGGCSKL